MNPLIDRAIERDPKIRQLVLELEQQSTARREQVVRDAESPTLGENR